MRMYRGKKILFVGYGRHGKDTAAKRYANWYPDTRYTSSSQYAVELFMYEALRRTFGYASAEECFEDRHNQRDVWHKQFAKFNIDDPARFAKALLLDYDIYVGMRAKRQVVGCFDEFMFDHVYWVDASRRRTPEPQTSMDFDLEWLINCPERNVPLTVIDNNGDFMYDRATYPRNQRGR